MRFLIPTTGDPPDFSDLTLFRPRCLRWEASFRPTIERLVVAIA
jgi:hypothetical protein